MRKFSTLTFLNKNQMKLSIQLPKQPNQNKLKIPSFGENMEKGEEMKQWRTIMHGLQKTCLNIIVSNILHNSQNPIDSRLDK